MDLENFEKDLNKHTMDLGEAIGALVEIEVMNQAILKTILQNQALQFEQQDPSKSANDYLQEFLAEINGYKNEQLAEVVKRISK